MSLIKEDAEMLNEQIKLLVDWNKDHIETEPEQVRRNIETIATTFNLFSNFQGIR